MASVAAGGAHRGTARPACSLFSYLRPQLEKPAHAA